MRVCYMNIFYRSTFIVYTVSTRNDFVLVSSFFTSVVTSILHTTADTDRLNVSMRLFMYGGSVWFVKKIKTIMFTEN